MFDPVAARRLMVDNQLRPSRILEPRVVAAMGEVPRELFVPERLATLAYIDEDIEIASRRYLMEPRVFGRLVQEVNVGPGDRALDVGTGTGYSAAVLSRLARKVVAVEQDVALANAATRHLDRLNVNNVVLKVAALAAGAPMEGPYDVILLEGSVEEVPATLKQQLADGGRIGAVVRIGGVGKARVIERHGTAFGEREIMDAATPLLPGFEKPRGFVF